jgi:hypothetical protein
MPGSEGRAAGGTWTQWSLATAGPGGMLTAPASRHQARQAKLATQEDAPAGSDGPTPRRDGGDAIDMPPELPGGHPDRVRPNIPLCRLTSIRDGTAAPGGGDSLADPTMAVRTISRRSVVFPISQVAAQPGWDGVRRRAS